MSKTTRKNTAHGKRKATTRAVASRRHSPPSAPPSGFSTLPYLPPVDVVEFGSLVNDVATRLLNGDIDDDTARSFANLARTVAQTLSVQVARARLAKSPVPDLRFAPPRRKHP